MSLQLESLIKQLDIDIHITELVNLKSRLVSSLGNSDAMQGILDRQCENRGEINCFPCKNVGICSLFQGIAHLDLDNIDSALEEFKSGNWHFRSEDEIWNGIIGQVFIGIAHEKNKNGHQAFIEYKAVLEFLVEHNNRFQASYAESARARVLEQDLNDYLQQLATRLSVAKQAQTNPPGVTPDVSAVGGREKAYLSLYSIPIYGTVTAGPDGEVYLDPYENTSTIVEKVELEGDTFDVFHVGGTASRDRQITLIPQQSYGWLKVRGLSMNGWPLPFDEKDYVLFQKSQTVDSHDFVIVSSRDMTGDDMLIVKRFDGSKSQFISKSTDTNRTYAPIPMDEDHKIVGVVIAVAKLAETEENQLNQHHENISDLKNDNGRYNELVQLVGGDQSVADRLIDYEKRKSPDFKRADCIEKAITRLLRDRMA